MQPVFTLSAVLHQYSDDSAFLWLLRDKATQDPQYSLNDLSDLDGRIEANIDGLRIADTIGWEFCANGLEIGESGEVFTAAVLALEGDDGHRLQEVLHVAGRSGEAFRGLISALGWVSHDSVMRWMPCLLDSSSLQYRGAALAGLAIRREDLGADISTALQEEEILLNGRALRAVGELKRRDLLPLLRKHLKSENEACRFWAGWSAVLLGHKAMGESLKSFVNFSTPFAYRAIQLVPRVLGLSDSQQWLRGLAQEEITRRFALIGCGVVGDPVYIPTLIKQMNVHEHARVAGEAFSMVTGIDLAYDDLDMDQPEDFEAGPTEDPEDENVDLDPDEDLPWPNQELVQKWWDDHGREYQAGTRYLCGQPISRENCRRVLIEGYQRQRIAAAYELALLNPDEPLFEWRAPGFRQQEWLGLKKPRARAS